MFKDYVASTLAFICLVPVSFCTFFSNLICFIRFVDSSHLFPSLLFFDNFGLEKLANKS